MKTLIARISLTLLIATCGAFLAAGEVTPPPTPVPQPPVPTPKPPIPAPQQPTPAPQPAATDPNKPPIPVTPKVVVPMATTGNNPNADMPQLLNDFLKGDAARRDELAKTFVARGAYAYRSLAGFVTYPNPELSKRAKEIRQQIENRAMQLLQDANTIQGKAEGGPLTLPALEEARKAWLTMGNYAPQAELRQTATQGVQRVQGMMSMVEVATKELAEREKDLATTPPPGPLARAAIQLGRSEAFTNLNRIDDALKAAQDAFTAGGRECRLAAAALKAQAEMFQRKSDTAGVETVCKKIIADYGESLEARFAYGALCDQFIELKRWDDAVEAVKKYLAACPIDDEPQEAADKLIDELMDKQRDYPRAYGFSTWIKGRLPESRVRPEVLRVLACCSEYTMHDLAKAEATYKALGTDYADIVSPTEIAAVLQRVKAKMDGKFPKEPVPTDEGPAGTLAKYLAAVRAQDAKLVAALVPADDATEESGKLTCEDCTLVHTVTFGDFIVKKVTLDGDKAVIEIDYYDTASSTPKTIVQHAVKEKDAWKIKWTDPDDQLNPPAADPKAQKPQK